MKEYKIIYEKEKSLIWFFYLLVAIPLTWLFIKSFHLIKPVSNPMEIWGLVGYLGISFIAFLAWAEFFSSLDADRKVPKYGETFIKGKIKEIQEVKYPKEMKTKFKTIWRDE